MKEAWDNALIFWRRVCQRRQVHLILIPMASARLHPNPERSAIITLARGDRAQLLLGATRSLSAFAFKGLAWRKGRANLSCTIREAQRDGARRERLRVDLRVFQVRH